MRKITSFLISIHFVFLCIAGENNSDSTKSIIITQWLKAGNFEVKLPAFSETPNTTGTKYSVKDILRTEQIKIDGINPRPGAQFLWSKEREASWKNENADKSGFIHPGRWENNTGYLIAYYASYIFTDRWAEVEIEINTPQICIVYLDGEKICEKLTFDKDNKATGKVTKKVKIEKGNHLLLIKSLRDKNSKTEWKIKGSLKILPLYYDAAINTSTKHKQILTINHLLEGENIENTTISPDAKYYSLTVKETLRPDGKTTSRTEIRKTDDHKLVFVFRNNNMSQFAWTQTGLLSYVLSDNDQSTIWLFDLDNGIEKKITGNIKDLAGYSFTPDGNTIILAITEKPDKNETGIRRIKNMPDRWPWWKNRKFLYKYDVETGLNERLTYGNISTSLQDISNDSKYILFTQNIPDFSEIPYYKEILFRMNIFTYEIDTIWKQNWGSKVMFSPDDESLLVIGGPSLFGSSGENISPGDIANNYDKQAYIYNFKTKTTESITFSFDPSIIDAHWDKSGEVIYLLTADRDFVNLYSYKLKDRAFALINTDLDVIENIDFARKANSAVYTGSSVSTPKKGCYIDLMSDSVAVISDPAGITYENIVFGKNEKWTFKNQDGINIDGRIYYPPDFESGNKYPLIVYYYGGTSPSNRAFGGRYPKNLYAAQGYVVYVLQPSGTYGYGQKFSSMHVNNWGKTVADEIIDGTKKFLEEHPFIDKNKVGCIGASYGGFMTMLIQTRTDIFSAAVAHAGISSISSYWGEGYWGYLYSAVASANSFPWNNKELYIEQSPLFHADKINTPLLLLHGASDTNVPPGESRQMYTALKLLGKDVELIEISEQDHHILDFKKRILWQKTILAWFDKWLKNQPAWWNDLYPEDNF